MKLNFKFILQKSMYIIAFICALNVSAQNQALELTNSTGNPTNNGPQASVSARFTLNTDHSVAGTTFATYTPAVNVTAKLDNQKYTVPNGLNGGPGNGSPAVVFGWVTALGSSSPGSAIPVFNKLNTYGGAANSDFTGSGSTAGTGMQVNSNYAFIGAAIANSLQGIVPSNQREDMADLTITFDRPVNNPILHFSGLGGSVGTGASLLPLSTEFNLISSTNPVTLSQLSGTGSLQVITIGGIQQINNSSAAANGSGATSGKGSVLVTGQGITELKFRVFISGKASGKDWGLTTSPTGDVWTMSVSFLESDLEVTKTVNNALATVGSNVIFTVQAINNGPSTDASVKVQDLLPSGYTYVSSTVSQGTYTPTGANAGLWDVGSIDGAGTLAARTKTLTITATVKATGVYTNTATITGGNGDTVSTNNTASATVTLPCTPPTISVQPLATQTICQNVAPTNLTVTASGTGLTYQWYSNTTNSTTGGTLISGQTSDSYTTSTSTAGTSYYYVIVTGTGGCSTTSTVSTVIVNPTTAITGGGPATQTVILNGAATPISITATGTNLTYSLYRNTTNSTTGGTLIGTSTVPTYTPPTNVLGTTYYYVIVNGTCGTVTSPVSTVTVIATANYCVSGCNENTFLKSSDPNTMEYDNIISTFHATLAREADNKIYLWGENTAPNGTSHLTTKTELSVANGFNFTGTILRMAGGSSGAYNFSQYAILTTTGLYAWANPGYLFDTGIKNTNAFGTVAIGTAGVSGGATKADGLPAGVSPSQVKMLFGSYQTLGLVTCTGDAWILSGTGNKNGDGTSEDATNNKLWHRVQTGAGSNLSNVVAMRGSARGMIALTSVGEVYTWGTNVYLGNGVAPASQTYAKKMTLPAGVIVKQIGMTQNTLTEFPNADPKAGVSYYMVSTTNKLYSLGLNNYRQLGDFTDTDRTSWVRVKEAAGTDMRDITWISPQEHDQWFAFANALTTTGKVFAWGHNDQNMIGGSNINQPTDPIFMPGNLPNSSPSDIYMAVESGGHATIVVKKCTNNFGYIGHRINGSMADGQPDGFEAVYTFNTSTLRLCGAATAPAIDDIIRICDGSTANLTGAFTGTVPADSQLKFFTDTALTIEVADPTTAGPGTYYAAFIETGSLACPNPPYTKVIVQYFVPGDAGYSTCACYEDPSTTTGGEDTKHGITLLKRAGATPVPNNWPMVRKGAFTALESNSKGFVITRMTTAQINQIKTNNHAVEGMMVYDTDLKCLKLYDGTNWSCFKTPACP